MASFGLFHQMVQDIDTRAMQTVFKPGLHVKTSWTDIFRNWSLNNFNTHTWTSWMPFVYSGPLMNERNSLDIIEYKERIQ